MATKVTYSPKDRERIIAHVLSELAGGRAVSRTLREDDKMCPTTTFWNWCFADETLMEKVTRAREHGVESIMDETLAIADQQEVGEIVTEEPIMVDGKPLDGVTVRKVKTEDMLGHRKLRIETRHKYAQMIAPRKYGPKLDLTSGGERLGLAAEIEAARRRAADAE